jgi:hypothetical protein
VPQHSASMQSMRPDTCLHRPRVQYLPNSNPAR